MGKKKKRKKKKMHQFIMGGGKVGAGVERVGQLNLCVETIYYFEGINVQSIRCAQVYFGLWLR